MFSSSSYDRFVSRGRGRGRGNPRAARRDSGQDRLATASEIISSPSPPTGPVLATIHYRELETDRPFSSENKFNVKAGKPPKWTPTARPTKLAEDNPNGTYYRDPNAAYFPSYPIEPVVQSIFEECPDFDAQGVDIFSCGSTLGNLLRFARNVETEKPFRFLVEVVGQTVFLLRRENSPKEAITDIRGYGHSFPEANTTWDADIKSSDTHQRIVRYQLGHLCIVMRFEADGYLVEEVPAKKTHASPINEKVGEDMLISALAENTISAHTPKNSDSLKIIRGQGSVPQSAIFDLKTRSIKKKKHDTTLSDQLPRLWIRQIPFLVLAYHDSGLFRSEEVTVRNIKPDVARWESEKKGDVRKLIDLIKKITVVVKDTPGRKLEVLYRYGTGLELRDQVEGVASVLPEYLAAQWTARGNEVELRARALRNCSVNRGVRLDHVDNKKRVAINNKIIDTLEEDEYD
ncbi:uncharacterized protein RCO7_10301 [Rhynchosporium graminicola]|uniref:Geranylgeranyl pyrophosphate synthetase n=1 Tax=Rhynchosporium graminicola TaxID=2792576 RepID=A0A1E1K8J8_9HELO|nr:uncharacterized protein RCO7_10301 [Rhynchosporium commune]